MHKIESNNTPAEARRELDPSILGSLGLAVALIAPHLSTSEASIALLTSGLAAIAVTMGKINKNRS